MLDVLLEFDFLVERVLDSVNFHADIARLLESVEHFFVLALSSAHDGGFDDEFRALGGFEHSVADLVNRLPFDARAAVRAVCHADARVEKAQIVVDLRDRAHRRAGVVGSRLLVDRDGGRKSVDIVHVRFVHLTEEHARVGGQALHVSALSFREDGVEREGGFSRARKTRKYHELVPRNRYVDVFQVVFAGAFHFDEVLHILSLSFCARYFLMLCLSSLIFSRSSIAFSKSRLAEAMCMSALSFSISFGMSFAGIPTGLVLISMVFFTLLIIVCGVMWFASL